MPACFPWQLGAASLEASTLRMGGRDVIHEAARNTDVSRGGLFQGSVFVDRVLRMGDATPAQVFAPAIAWRLRQPVTASVLLRAADLA